MEPQAKRRKDCVCETDSWLAYPVLSDEQSQEVELIEAFAAPVINKKETSRLVRELSSLYPLNDLQHIKRVRACKEHGSPHPLEILVCLRSEAPDRNVVSLHSLLPSGVGHDGLGEPFVVKIPSRLPLTRPQFELARKHWPTSFHEDKQVAVALRGELFTSLQKAQMHMHMSSAVTIAKAGKEMGMEAVGAVVVEPLSQKVIAMGHDCRGQNPLHHAVMVCIDLVAWSQGGGCNSYDRFPACRFISFQKAPDTDASAQPYICTGYDLFVTREPCIQCAMALVHSRISRVFYGTTSIDGAFGTKFKIHCQKDLNHRFEVFGGVLSTQCEDLNRSDERIQEESLEECT